MPTNNGIKLRRDVGGYRAVWLIFLEAFTTSLMIYLWLKFGFWYGAVLLIPFFAIVKKVESSLPYERFDYRELDKGFDHWIKSDNKTKVPNHDRYKTNNPKRRPKLSLHAN